MSAAAAARRAAGHPETGVRADGSAVLSPADLLIVADALGFAADGLRERASRSCGDCEGHPAGACESHLADLDDADAADAVAGRLAELAPAADEALRAEVAAALDAAADAAERLGEIRGLLARFDRERHDRQVCLEAIDRIAAGAR